MTTFAPASPSPCSPAVTLPANLLFPANAGSAVHTPTSNMHGTKNRNRSLYQFEFMRDLLAELYARKYAGKDG